MPRAQKKERVIRNSVFTESSASLGDGGVVYAAYSSMTLIAVQVTNAHARRGGAFFLDASTFHHSACTISGTNTTDQGGLFLARNSSQTGKPFGIRSIFSGGVAPRGAFAAIIGLPASTLSHWDVIDCTGSTYEVPRKSILDSTACVDQQGAEDSFLTQRESKSGVVFVERAAAVVLAQMLVSGSVTSAGVYVDSGAEFNLIEWFYCGTFKV